MIINSLVGGSGTMIAIAYPVLSGTYTYNGSTQTPTFTNYDSTSSTIGGTYSATNAGSYTATFTPKDGYCWIDGSTDTYSLTWAINKATGSITLSSTSGTLRPAGATATFTITKVGDGTLSVSSSSTSIATVSLSGTTATVTCIGSGTATITAAIPATTNYTAASATYAATCYKLPAGYTEVEYIDIYQKNIFDTSFTLDATGYSIEAVVSPLSYESECKIFSFDQSSGGYRQAMVCYSSSGGLFIIIQQVTTRTVLSKSSFVIGTKYTINSTISTSGITASCNGSSQSITASCASYCFAPVEAHGGSCRYYGITVKRSGSVFRTYVPCTRDSDSVAGLYELTNSTFFAPV